ncbi:MAG TPA: phosphoglycerate dehydrogenase [Candidatus Acidoferrales bacterium]|nr:phosphoglycerate dehydrogenase [Candidatus Acidoferrales bacterium]
MKIVIAEKLGKAGMQLLTGQSGWTVITPEEYAKNAVEQLRDAEALIVRSAVQVTDAVLEGAPKLRVIGRAGVGVDNIEMPAATRRGILVMNTPGGNAIAVAELALGLMLSLARQIPRATEALHANRWEKKSLEGTELRAKTLGVVGLGRIGLEVARRALALGMNVIASDPFAPPELARKHSVKLVPLDEVFATSDYITLHVGLTPQTQGMINKGTLAKMKPGVRIVNCARGELVEDCALVEALKSGHVAGAALDVFTNEPLKDSPFMGMPNVILTPHIAGSTREAQEAIALQIASQVREYLLNGVAQNAVNVPSVSDQEYEQMRPYMGAAQKTGSLLGQLFRGNLEEIGIAFEGTVGEWSTALIRNAAIAGVLQHDSVEKINYVNAAAAAQDRGIRVSEEKRESQIPAVCVQLRGAGVELSAKCSVVHGASRRLIELNGVDIESELEGKFLVFENLDKPGVIGGVGGLLGKNDVNIARFSLGRNDPAESAKKNEPNKALAIVQVDSTVSESVLEQLRALPSVLTVTAVVL